MNNQPDNQCPTVEPTLTAYLLGDLPAEAAAQVKAHLEQCAACRAAAQDLEATLGFLRDALAPGSAGALTGVSSRDPEPQLGQTGDARLKLGTTNGEPVLDAAHLEAIRRSVREAAAVSPAGGATARTNTDGHGPAGTEHGPRAAAGRRNAVLHMKDFRKRFPFLFWRNADNSLRPAVLFFLKTAATFALLGVLVWLLLPSIYNEKRSAFKFDIRGGTEFSIPLSATQSSARPSLATVRLKPTAMQVKEIDCLKIEKQVDKMDEVVPTVEQPNISDGSASSYALGLNGPSESGGSVTDFNNDMPATTDGADANAVLDVKLSQSPIRIAGIYGGRSSSGRRGLLGKFGGGTAGGDESDGKREEATKREAAESEQLSRAARQDQYKEQAQKSIETKHDMVQPANGSTTYAPVVAAAEPVKDVPPPPAEAVANFTLGSDAPAPVAAAPEEKAGWFGKLKGLVTTTHKHGAAIGTGSDGTDVAYSPSVTPASPMPAADMGMGFLAGTTSGALLGDTLEETVKDTTKAPGMTTVFYDASSVPAATTAPTSGLTKSGSGTLALNGDGILTLDGDNSYSGTTIVSAGTVVVSGKPEGIHGVPEFRYGRDENGRAAGAQQQPLDKKLAADADGRQTADKSRRLGEVGWKWAEPAASAGEKAMDGDDGKAKESTLTAKDESRKRMLEDAPPPASKAEPLDLSGINPFVTTEREAFSTFGIDVDTAAYTLARNAFREGRMPEPNRVRVEEFVNAFDYDYAPPPAGRAFAIHADSAPSPFRPRNELLKIGVKGYQLARNAKAGAVLTFAIDGSGSMNTEDRLGLVRSSLKLLLGQLRPDDRVAIVQFNDKARLVLSATPVAEKQKILAAIDAIQAAGPTNLEGGLRLAYETAARAFTAGAANRVLLLSDGVANLGAAGADDILKTIEAQRKQGIYLSVYGVGSGAYNDKMLQQLADKGDGTYQFLDSEAEVKRVFVDQLAANLFTIAKDVKIQVEFNKARVAQYRQLGYEKRKLTKEQFRDDTVDAGEVGAGQSATALYELVLRGTASEPIGIVRVRYKNIATGMVEEIQQTVTTSDRSADSAQAPVRFRLAACVAEFAELLRGSPHVQGSSYTDVAKVLRPVVLELRLNGQVQELGRLVHQAEGMGK